MPASATTTMSARPCRSWNALTIGMIVAVSALLPSKQPISSGNPSPVDQQPDDDLRVDAAFLGVADLAQVVFLLGLEVQRRHVVEDQGDVPAGGRVLEARLGDLVAVSAGCGATQGAFHRRVAGRPAAQVGQHPAGVQQRGRFHDPGDHQVPEHLIADRVEARAR